MKKRIALAVCVGTILTSSNIYADGFIGSGSDSLAGGGNGGVSCLGDRSRSRIDCQGVSWLKYNYIGGKELEGQSYLFTPYNGYESDGKEIGGACAKEGVGFYHLGINALGNNEMNKSYSSFGDVSSYGLLDYNGIGTYFNGVGSSHLNGTNSKEKSYDYIYRIVGKQHIGHRFSLSIQGAGGYYNNSYDTDGYVATLNNGSQEAYSGYAHLLYYRKNGEYKPMYLSESSATSKDNIAKQYETFLNDYYPDGNNAPDSAISAGGSSVCSYSGDKWSCSQMPDNIYAFCAFSDNKATELYPKAKLKYGSEQVETNYTFSGSNSDVVAKPGVIEVRDQVITVEGDFKFKIDNAIKTTSFTPSLKVGGEIVSAKDISFSGTTTEIGDGLGSSAKTKTVRLFENTDTRLCATVDVPSKIGMNKTEGHNRNAQACMTFRYVPVAAEIDSDSLAILDSSYYTSGTDQQKTYDIDVDAGPKQISWAHYMGYKNRSDGKNERITVNVRGVKGGCDGIANGVTIDSYVSPSVPGGYNLTRLSNNMCDEGTPVANNTSASTSRENTTKSGAFPGETKEEYQMLEHPSKIGADGSAGSGYDERSQVTLRLHANDIQCGLRNGDLGVTKDYLYSIGVDNPYDYRWLAVYRTSGGGFPAARALVGDGMHSYETLWLSPKDRIMFSQTACFGSQIAIDSQNPAEDRWTSNPWSNLSDSTNSKFTLDTAQAIKGSTFFGNNYQTASGLRSTDGPSFRASEIGGEVEFKNPNSSASSTPQSRINDGYKIETTTNERQIGSGNVGESLSTTFSKPNGDGATVNIKVPYNYDLDLSLGSGNNILDSGEITKFTAQIKNKKRVNMQVCNGVSSNSNTVCNDYSTESKPTYYGMLVFAMDSNFKYSDLNGHTNFTSNGNAFEGTGDVETKIKNKVESELGKSISSVVSYTPGAGSGNSIPSANVRKIESDEIDYGDYPVGTKICAAIVAYPSDSHNMPGVNVIDDNYQWAAFDEGGSLTRYTVTCRTVAKYQTMSVEGNGAVTLSNMSTSDVIYKNRVFKSWSEYQIIAGSSNAASGAVTAYGLGNPATSVNQKHSGFDANPSLYSIENDSSLSHYPQSFGNYNLFWGNTAAGDEASVNYGYAQALRKNLIDTYGGGESCNEGEIAGKKAYLVCESGELSPTYVAGMDTIIVRSNNTLTLSKASRLGASERWAWGYPKQIIIIANNILVNGDVENIKAWLVVASDYGTLNTCAGHKLIGGEAGHEDLFRDCYAPLVIDGPVISGSGLELLRTYGGGSKKVDDEIVADPDSYVQRAEIFNYDPGVVRWAYEESLKNPQVVTTYTEDLAPRL